MTLQEKGTAVRRRVILSVKGGKILTPDFVRALATTVDHEKADYGVLITMHEPSQGMRDVARECGTVPWSAGTGKLEHRIRIITVVEILAKTSRLPPGENMTPRSQSMPPPPEARQGETLNLPFQPRQTKGPKKTKYPTVAEPQFREVADSVRPPKK
jgi:hypothetical protein